MPQEPSFHMTSAEFRRNSQLVVDWIARYMDEVETLPVGSRAAPGQIRSLLPRSAPQTGESVQAILRDLDEIILPGITHWQSPRFFGFFPANASGPSILGELLSAALGVQGMLWVTSPACTELETHVLDWLIEMLDLPRKFSSGSSGSFNAGGGGGVIQDTASSATLCALLAARERAGGVGNGLRPLKAYASNQAHSSVQKAVMIAGLGRESLRLIDVDDHCALVPDRLEAAIKRDREAGCVPAFVCATVGTTSSNAIDPVEAIGEICQRHGLWLHVDAAMSGTAALCPEFRFIHQGLERADSYCFNPHKWMFVNFDCDCFWVADRAALIRALSVQPEYLRNPATQSGAVFDYRDWQIPLGRRFRALKLWFVIRHYGIEGLQHHVREHVRLAKLFAEWVERDDRFELVAPPPLNLVCFRHRGGDACNEQLRDRLNASGKIYLTHTRLKDRLTLRLCVGQTQTRQHHVEAAWRLIQQTAENL